MRMNLAALSVSALTLAAGRAAHLRNLVRGLQAQTRKPCELIVAVMQPEPYADLPATDFPLRQIMVAQVGGELPLSAARNRAAAAATGDVLAFIDVDCVPDPDFIADYAAAATPGRGVVMGEVLYLPAESSANPLDFAAAAQSGVRHSDRRAPPAAGLERCEDYRCFWSLNFAMHRRDWAASGGFDERYVGYGGEDTDFARSLDAQGAALWWTRGARVYHQHHPQCMPPIHRVASVVRNADLFASKWGHRTMEHWLYAFETMGLIERRDGAIRIARAPDEADFALCRQAPDMPYANTRRVLDILQGVAAARRGDARREAEVRRAQAAFLDPRPKTVGRKLRIALVAHVRHPIAQPFMGGMEAHAWHLARLLAERGHQVTLFASGDSDPGPDVALRPLLPEHYDRRFPWAEHVDTPPLNRLQDEAFAAAFDEWRSGAFDVVHNNSLHRFPPRLARRDRIAMVTSLHVPPFDALFRAVRGAAAPWSRFTACSEAHLRAWWPEGAPETAHVAPNGLDLARWRFVEKPGTSAVWAGRITPNKGPHLALDAARLAGVPITLYGAVEDQDYFRDGVAPRLGAGAAYGGHLDPGALAAAFAQAAVALFTPLWDEPFGLTAVEAMACGTPVAATDIGATRAVIGEAGRFAPPGDAAALARAVREAAAIPRRVPRRRVEARFSAAAMLDAYEAVYARAIAGLSETAPPVSYSPADLPPEIAAAQ